MLLFAATMINYMDRQVLSLTWKDFISPEFHWTDADYGILAGAFSIVYSISMLFVGKVVDRIGTRKGYLYAIGLWSLGACLHAFCGIITSGILIGNWSFSFQVSREILAAVQKGSSVFLSISTVSLWLFLGARIILAIGESGNFPCAIKAVAEYFPKQDRGFATSIFNVGAQMGALFAPFTIPLIARYLGWEMSFLLIGLLGFFWMFIWIWFYDAPRNQIRVNKQELAYIEQDGIQEIEIEDNIGISGFKLLRYFTFRNTWTVIFARCLPDGVWWFFLFWTPAYVKDVYGYSSDSFMGMLLIFSLYLISMFSIMGGYLPTYLIERKKEDPLMARMKVLLLFALFPLLGVFAQPLGEYSCWYPIIIIGIIGAAHQSWSANAYTLVSDLFPKSSVATVTGIGGMAGGIGSLLFNWGSGILFTYSKENNMEMLGFTGIQAGYMLVFLLASVSYLLSWLQIWIMVDFKNTIVR